MCAETLVEGFHDEQAWSKMKYRDFMGKKISILGMGGSSFGDCFRTMSQAEVNEIVLRGLAAGINWIDTAYWYGQGSSETRLGIALENVPRQSYYIHSKIGRYGQDFHEMFDFSAERTLRAVDESLEKLNCKYLDCMQVS